jgi:outer membrane autotransporter protein
MMLAAQPSQAQFYVSGSAGYLQFRDNDASVPPGTVTGEYNSGFMINGAAGYKFNFGLRLEGEAGYGRTSVDKFKLNGATIATVSGGDIDIFTGTANAFYDIKTGTSFTPYLGGGIGFAYSDASDATVSGVRVTGGSSTDFLWLVEAGVSIAVTDRLSVVPAYRYLQIANGQSGGFGDDIAHLFKIGLRYSF